MAKEALVELNIRDGLKFVDKLLDAKVPFNAAFWACLPEYDTWRLFIASTLSLQNDRRLGYREIFEHLQTLMGTIRDKAFSIDFTDVQLLNPDDHYVILMIKIFGELSELTFTNFFDTGTRLSVPCIYFLHHPHETETNS